MNSCRSPKRSASRPPLSRATEPAFSEKFAQFDSGNLWLSADDLRIASYRREDFGGRLRRDGQGRNRVQGVIQCERFWVL